VVHGREERRRHAADTRLLQNGGYINPPRIKRQFRDPYADWWDPQERRNFGEPVHEDNDLMGIFSPYEYTWTTTGPGLLMIGTFVATFMSVLGVVFLSYPDRPSYPREFEEGLERELGGVSAVRVGTATVVLSI
jgi:NADH dehydrogenase (ubiquinone) 1 beta subcomplex subunit 8